MALIDWKDEYTVGHPRIDEDHRNILRILDRIARASTDQQAAGYHEVVNDLFEALSRHWTYEIRVFTDLGFQDIEAHCAAHERIHLRLVDLLLTAEPDVQTLIELAERLVEDDILAFDALNFIPPG